MGKRTKRSLAAVLALADAVMLLGGCSSGKMNDSALGSYSLNKNLNSGENVSLHIEGTLSDFKALENVISSFEKLYPECDIEYEYLQDYENAIVTRLSNNDNVDLFMSYNIQKDSPYMEYALNLDNCGSSLDLSTTYDGFIKNYTYADGSSNGTSKLYAVPLGGEIRGMYVNTTLLSSMGLSTPENYTQLIDCCRSLLDAGYVPMQGNPGSFGQQLMYPYVCNIIVNSQDPDSVYNEVNTCAGGVSELFREPMKRLYEIMENGYYNYKYIENTYGTFTDTSDETIARDFLNIVENADGSYSKKDDCGQVAFMPGAMSLKGVMAKVKEDYHSNIDYEFILSPVGDEGGFAYLSPAAGLAVNKNSTNVSWALEFLNYIFSKDVNKKFAKEQGVIPNTTDAMDTLTQMFSIGNDRISQLGQVSFNYMFYDIIKTELIEISKGNNPKYMKEDGSLYDFDYYMGNLAAAFDDIRGSIN